MSNIRTSYIRIYRRDGLPLSEEESEQLFRLAVSAYGEFGSYWVRILKKNRPEERCLDIQFGSSKRYHSENQLETYEIFSQYYIWERTADEGGFPDTIFTFTHNVKKQWIETTLAAPCLYRFDKVLVECDELPDYLKSFHPEQKSSTQYKIALTGTYYACNSRSFMDLHDDSEFYGPKLGYDPFYASDFFVASKDGNICDSDNELLKSFFAYPHKELINNIKLELYWKNRLVQSVEHIGDDVNYAAADYWDNCCHLEYLDFIKSFEFLG